jgi:tripeptidyl-peptidase-1
MRCLEELYRLPRPFPPVIPEKRNSLGIAGFTTQYANYQDLQLFPSKQQPDYLKTNFTFIPVNGGLNSQILSEAGTEADIDIQIARGLAP